MMERKKKRGKDEEEREERRNDMNGLGKYNRKSSRNRGSVAM
jgi:hypothetical protein